MGVDETAITGSVTFRTWTDNARGMTTVKVDVNGAYVGKLEMTDHQLLTFADFINPPYNGSSQDTDR